MVEILTKFTHTMASIKNLVSFVAVLAFAVLSIAGASAATFATITDVQVNGIHALNAGTSVAATSGDTLPVLVVFTANSNATDVRIKAWVSGNDAYAVASDRFDVIAGNVYSKLMSVNVPSNTDPNEPFKLEVSVEGTNAGVGDQAEISLAAQRPNYAVDLLDVSADSQVTAGSTMGLDIVLKNTGLHLAQDSFVTVKIPALGIEQRAYFGDLSPVDQSNPDLTAATERKMFVSIPSDAPAGVYSVEIDADNADTHTVATKKVAIVGAGADSMVVSPITSKTFDVSGKGSYSMTIVNSGNKIAVYTLGFQTGSGLTVTSDQPAFAIPAGSSQTVTFDATADSAGTYNFAATVSSNGNLVKQENFTANVTGNNFAGSATVLVTLVLAIIFVVLLVVLIVLLTKKPQKAEEFGESYY